MLDRLEACWGFSLSPAAGERAGVRGFPVAFGGTDETQHGAGDVLLSACRFRPTLAA